MICSNSLTGASSDRFNSVYTVFQALDILLGTISIWSLVSLTVERLVAVKFPAYHFNLTWKPVAMVLGFTWCLGIIFGSLEFLVDDYIPRKEFIYFLFSANFALPTVVIVSCYFVIFQIARDSAAMANRRFKKDMKIAVMILIIIGLFLLCWLPFFALNIAYYACPKLCTGIPTWLTPIFKAMHYSNSMMNFLVYAARSPDFRRSFTALIQWKLPRFRSDTLTSVRLRKRTFSNPNSNDNSRSNGNIANNDTLATPLPDRAHADNANLTAV